MKKEVKNNKKIEPWVTVLIILACCYLVCCAAIFGIAFFVDGHTTSYEIDNNIVNIKKGKLTISDDIEGYYDDATNKYYIVGYLHNNSERDYKNIEIEYNVYDAQKNILGNATATISELKKGEIWKFKVIYEDLDANEVDSYKFSYIDV